MSQNEGEEKKTESKQGPQCPAEQPRGEHTGAGVQEGEREQGRKVAEG